MALKAFRDTAEKSLIPADKREIAGHIERLTVHYWAKVLDDNAMRLYVQDWLADVGHLPADILAAACARWRQGDKAFMPTPGQLLALAAPIHSFRAALHKRAADLLTDNGE